MLTERQRRFADAYGGDGTALAAIRTAGHAGRDEAARAEASKLLRHAGVRAAIEERGVALPPMRPGRGRNGKSKRARPEVQRSRTGTQTDHAALAWRLARDTKLEPLERLKALELCAKICGELGPGRYVAPPPPVIEPATADPVSESSAASAPPRIRLIVNANDASSA